MQLAQCGSKHSFQLECHNNARLQNGRNKKKPCLLTKVPSLLTSVISLTVNTFSLHVSSPVNTPLSHRLRREIERDTVKHECVDLSRASSSVCWFGAVPLAAILVSVPMNYRPQETRCCRNYEPLNWVTSQIWVRMHMCVRVEFVQEEISIIICPENSKASLYLQDSEEWNLTLQTWRLPEIQLKMTL